MAFVPVQKAPFDEGVVLGQHCGLASGRAPFDEGVGTAKRGVCRESGRTVHGNPPMTYRQHTKCLRHTEHV